MDRLAGPTLAQVGLGEASGQLARHLALHGGLLDDVAHVASDGVERFEDGDARSLQRLGGVVDAFARVGVVVGAGGGRDLGDVTPSVGVGRAADRPGVDELGVVELAATQTERPPRRPWPAGVLDAEVQDRTVGDGTVAGQPMLVVAEPQELLARDVHACFVAPVEGVR